MNILFVDDQPEHKIDKFVQYLSEIDKEMSVKLVSCSNVAKKYITDNVDSIDLIVLDLGLPIFRDGYGYGKKEGLTILQLMLRKNITNIPVIINSTTELDDEEYFKPYKEKGFRIEHFYEVTREKLINFMKAEN